MPYVTTKAKTIYKITLRGFVCYTIFIFLSFSCPLFAQEYSSLRDKIINENLDKFEIRQDDRSQFLDNANIASQKNISSEEFSKQKQEAIDKTLRKLAMEISLEYLMTYGQQTFEIVDSSKRRISRLHYPQRGRILISNMELRLNPKLSFGASYGTSRFRRTTSTDTDWLPTISPAVWWESHSDCKASLEKYDLDVYFRFLDSENASLSRRLKENLSIDKLSLDIFVGYLHQRGRYGMANLIDTVEWWIPTNNPLERLDSFYKVTYDGPQVGLRAIGSSGKVTTRLSFAYIWLKTKAHGWWNMREYAFWQTGDNSKGIDLKSELIYNLSKNWFLGLGYNFAYLPQEKLEESGVYYTHPADNYDDLDIVRNVDNKLHGPLLKLGYIW